MGMGYEGVRTAVAHLQGAPVDLRQDTGVRLATRDNMNDPEIAELLTPDLARYLEQ
jgi:ribose transport system substrate-binding protein